MNYFFIMKYFSSMSFIFSSVLIFFSFFFFFLSSSSLLYTEIIFEWEIFNLMGNFIYLIFIFDFISLFFFSLVCLISGSILLYSTSYMSNEMFFSRFLLLVLLFVLSMSLLILSPNLISLLLGWDGLGVTSYLLVVFYQSNKSYNAGMITALTNRLGDVGILISIGLMVFLGDWTFFFFSEMEKDLSSKMLMIIIIISACTKSAQIPFSSWLPAAMAAPTPVSALVHSSTLVTAGVYLLIRFNFFIIKSYFCYFLMLLGIFTMLMAGMAAMLEMDMKKVIALSTLSQLGVMMMIIGAQKPLLAYFHLLSHAYFKAMLFMCAGMIIHNMKDYQDIRCMGTLNISMPLICSIMNTANISLCGLPFMSGFYSKDIILEMMLLDGYNMFLFMMILLATMLTVSYSCRLSFHLSSNSMKLENMSLISEMEIFMVSGMFFLLPFAIFGGMNLNWMLMSSSSFIFLPFWFKSSILILIISGVFFLMFLFKNNFYSIFFLPFEFFSNMWFMPLTFSKTLSMWALNLRGKNSIKLSESSWLEWMLFKQMVFFMKKMSTYIFSLTSNYFLSSFFIYIFMVIIFN